MNEDTKICRLVIFKYRSVLQSRFRFSAFIKERRFYSSFHISRIFDIRTASSKLNLNYQRLNAHFPELRENYQVRKQREKCVCQTLQTEMLKYASLVSKVKAEVRKLPTEKKSSKGVLLLFTAFQNKVAEVTNQIFT